MGLNDAINTLEIRLQLPGMAFQTTRLMQDRIEEMKADVQKVVDEQLKHLDLEEVVRQEVCRQIQGILARYVDNAIHGNADAMQRISNVSRKIIEELSSKLFQYWGERVEDEKRLEADIEANRREKGDAGS